MGGLSGMVTVLSEQAVRESLELSTLLDTVEEALIRQASGAVERPPRPHFPIGAGIKGDGTDPLGTGLAMPAYCHGDPYFATKLVAVNEGNRERGLPTIHAQIVLTDARTGVPEAVMDGTVITNARTGCVGGLAVRHLAPETATLGVLGAGAQARWQIRAIAEVTSLEQVRIFSPNSRESCAQMLREEGIPATAVASPREAVADADAVVTATTSTEPVFPADALAPDALVIAIGAYTAEMQEVPAATLDDASAVFADTPKEVAAIGDLQASSVDESDLIALGELFQTGYSGGGSLVVESVGSAVMDVAAAQQVYEQSDGGVEVQLSVTHD